MEPRDAPKSGKYCDFHEEHGHDTDDCRQLKKEVKAAIQAGKLNHLLPGKKFKKTDEKKTYGWQKKGGGDPSGPPDAVIHMIQSATTSTKRKAEVLADWQLAPISFPPMRTNAQPEPVIITARIANCQVSRVYTDTGSAVEVMYEHCFLQLPEHIRDRILEPTAPLSSYANESKWPIGRLTLDVTLGDYPRCMTAALEFVIVRAPSRFNVLLGRTALAMFGAITSTVHGLMKFPTPAGIATVHTQSMAPQLCAQISESVSGLPSVVKEEEVVINPGFPEQKIRVGTALSAPTRLKLCEILAKNTDVFAWQDSEMTGVPRTIAEHKLNVNTNITPVRQKKRGMAPERSRFICEEVNSLVRAGIMREVHYQSWVANPVLVKKSDGKWRMCVDFKDINKAYLRSKLKRKDFKI